MTNKQYRLLRVLAGKCVIPGGRLSEEDEAIFATCKKEGWVTIVPPHQAKITSLGYGAMLNHEEQIRKERAALALQEEEKEEELARLEAEKEEELARTAKETKRQFMHDWRIAAFEVFGGFFLGAVVEHYTDIIDFIFKLLPVI